MARRKCKEALSVVARGWIPPEKAGGPHLWGADMTYYETPQGGAVFSAGSITFGGALQGDAVLTRMIKNVLEHFGN
jgi:hypothetical protein